MVDWSKPIERVWSYDKTIPAEVLRVLPNGTAVLLWDLYGMKVASVISPSDTGFRNVPAAPKLVPFTFDTFPRGVVYLRVKGSDDEIYLVTVIGEKHVWRGAVTGDRYESLLSGWELSTDGGKTWLPCGRMEE